MRFAFFMAAYESKSIDNAALVQLKTIFFVAKLGVEGGMNMIV